ncbi:MAG: glycosyltransferase [Actinomycetales bacterium]
MRVQLISHDASRSGAPRVAALVARCLVDQGHQVSIVSRTAGPLLKDFRQVSPCRVEPLWRVRRRLRRPTWLRPLARLADAITALIMVAVHRPQMLYLNSCAVVDYLGPARLLRVPVVLHVHESGPVAANFIARPRRLARWPRLTVVACSPSVRVELAQLTGIAVDDIVLLPSVPDDAAVLSRSAASGVDRMGDPAVVVGSCGSVEYRKGYDLLIAAAQLVGSRAPELDIRFVWIGDLIASGALDGHVEFLGPRADPYPLMRGFDLLALPSRDDPFPLVVLEAMVLGKPVVAFDVGGVRDQIAETGVLVPAEDVSAFADAVVELARDRHRRLALGDRAHERARAHFSTAHFCELLGDIISEHEHSTSRARPRTQG